MEQLNLAPLSTNICFVDQRDASRYHAPQLLAITNKGTGQVVNIGTGGLSFGCLYPHKFPPEFELDLLDASGTFIKQVRVRKIWQNTFCANSQDTQFEITVGVEFCELSARQLFEVSQLISSLEKNASRYW